MKIMGSDLSEDFLLGWVAIFIYPVSLEIVLQFLGKPSTTHGRLSPGVTFLICNSKKSVVYRLVSIVTRSPVIRSGCSWISGSTTVVLASAPSSLAGSFRHDRENSKTIGNNLR